MGREENIAKYGDKNNDIIAMSLRYSPDFCVFNAIKYAQRIKNVSQMDSETKAHFINNLHKGGESDFNKIKDYIDRCRERYPSAADWAQKQVNEILDGIEQ